MEKDKKPYPDPTPRTFAEWGTDMGMLCEGHCPDADREMSYKEFCFLPATRLRKIAATALYGFWRKYKNDYAEPRTVKEWLHDFNWTLVEPTEQELADLGLFLGHDAFWQWSSGKVEIG